MANKVTGILLFVLIATTLVGLQTMQVKAQDEPMCPQFCRADLEYMTCGSSDEKISPVCLNCCNAPKDCTLHYGDGTSEFCGK